MRSGPYLSAIAHKVLILAVALGVGQTAFAGDEKKGETSKQIPIAVLDRKSTVDFETEVLPVLRASCLACHNKTKSKAKLVLETPADIRRGGESGPAAVAGKGMESLLVKAAAHAADVDSPMPPPNNPANAPDLTSAQLGLLRLWIDEGATGEIQNRNIPPRWVKLAPVLQPIYAVAISPDGQYAACGRGNHIDVYNLPTGQLASHLTDPGLGKNAANAAHRDLVESVAFSPDGMWLASGSYREIKIWRRPIPSKRYALAPLGEDGESLTATSDGKLIAVGDKAGRIQLFKASTGKAAGILTGHEGAVAAMCFSDNGEWLASISQDMTVRVWNVIDRALFCKSDDSAESRSITWVDGKSQIAIGGADGTIRIWNVGDFAGSEMRVVGEIKGHAGAVNAVAGIRADGNKIISGGEDGMVRIWDLNSGRIVRELKQGAPVTSLAMRGDGKRFASAGMDGDVRLWNIADGNQIAEMRGDPALEERSKRAERALSLATSEIGYCKAQGSLAEKEKALQTTRLQNAKAAFAAMSKDFGLKQKALGIAKASVEVVNAQIESGKRSADAVARAEESLKALKESLAADKHANKENARDQAELAVAGDAIKKAKDALGAMKLGDRKKTVEAAVTKATADLANVSAARTIAQQEITSAGQSNDIAMSELARANSTLKSAETARVQRESELAAAKKASAVSGLPTRSLAFSPDGQLLAASGDDGLIRTLYSEKGTPGDVIRGWRLPIQSIVFSGARSVVALKRTDGNLSAWDIAPSWTLERTIGSPDGGAAIADRVTSLDFNADGTVIASGGGVPSRGGEIKLWEASSGKLIRSFDDVHVDSVTAVRFSPDGRRLASGSTDRFVRIIDLASGKVVLSLEGHQHHVLGVAWRRNGHTIASAGADNTLRFWNADTGARDNTVAGFDKEVTSVCFIGDSDQALVTSGDGKVISFHDNGTEGRPFPCPMEFVYAATATPDGKMIVAGGDDGVLRAWDAATGQIMATFNPP